MQEKSIPLFRRGLRNGLTFFRLGFARFFRCCLDFALLSCGGLGLGNGSRCVASARGGLRARHFRRLKELDKTRFPIRLESKVSEQGLTNDKGLAALRIDCEAANLIQLLFALPVKGPRHWARMRIHSEKYTTFSRSYDTISCVYDVTRHRAGRPRAKEWI